MRTNGHREYWTKVLQNVVDVNKPVELMEKVRNGENEMYVE